MKHRTFFNSGIIVSTSAWLTMIASLISVASVWAVTEIQDPVDTRVTEYWNNGRLIHFEEHNDRIQRTWHAGTEVSVETDQRPAQLHPLVASWLSSRDGDELVGIIVTTRYRVPIPQFPEYDTSVSRSSPVNAAVLQQTDEIIANIQQQRAVVNQPLIRTLQRMGGRSFRQYWIAPSVRVTLPLQAIRTLLDRPEILHIDPVQGDEIPPDNNYEADDVVNARALIRSDPYYNQGLTDGWIALLDTGVNRDHQMLSKPESRIDFWKDCTDNSIDCSGPEPGDTCWSHGTASAGLISGTDSLGSKYRGVTGILIDSYKVYPDNNGVCGGVDYDATVVAFQEAVRWGARVVVAEMQASGDAFSAISMAADGAFDAGAVVVAAAGNNGPAYSTINAPANAHKVIGVGAYSLTTGGQSTSQSRGPALDGRTKPDIQMPTGAETASTGCFFGIPCSSGSDEALEPYTGTSGAVPFAGGAAALLRNWITRTRYYEPGHVYASLIMSGQDYWPFDHIAGAGPSILPVNGITWRSKVTISHNELIEIPLDIEAETATDLDVGLWWPEHDAHSNIDMAIVSPDGVEEGWSNSSGSVFERARAEGPIETGIWTIQLLGVNVVGEQTVYVSARVANVLPVCSGSLSQFTPTLPIQPIWPISLPWLPPLQIWGHAMIYSVDCPD